MSVREIDELFKKNPDKVFTPKEISKELGLGLRTVYFNLSRIKKREEYEGKIERCDKKHGTYRTLYVPKKGE